MSLVVVLITGTNSGVGYAASKVIASASQNFHVIMTGRSLKKVQTAMHDLQTIGVKGGLSSLQLDVNDDKSIEQAVAHVDQQFGRLDVLINNAGVGNRDPNIKVRLQACLQTNVVGPAVVSAAFRPLLFKSPKPYSIFISSGGGSMTKAADPTSIGYKLLANAEAYRASKAALNMIALQESIEFESTPLKVFAVCPGFVRSNLRGTSEEEISGWGGAGDPDESGKNLLRIIQGERDSEAGKFLHNDGLYPW